VLISTVRSGEVAAEPSPFKIGVLSGLTGIAAKYGHYQDNGARLAQEEFNAAGIPVELLFEDSQTNGGKAVTGFNKLIDLDHVDAVFSTDFGFAIAPVVPLAARRGKLLVSCGLPNDVYCKQGRGYFFSVSSQFKSIQAAFDRFFSQRPEIKRAALFAFDDPEWGHSYQRVWNELAKKYGVTITDEFLTSEPVPEYRSLLARALAKRPDVLLLAHEPITFAKAVTNSGFKGTILAANNFLEVLHSKEDLGNLVERVVIAAPPISAEFARSYEARFNEPPILEAYSGYEGIRVIVKALKADRAHPEKAMTSIKYTGVAGGLIDFTTSSCAGNFSEYTLARIEGGRVVRLP
jgi:branched-chain amino acid transport system substrate-binding protein